MGRICCAVGCDRNTPDVTLHKFPVDKRLRAKWVAAVRRINWSPSEHSRLCSAHFTDECYELSVRLSLDFGIAAGARPRAGKLKPDAVPTIFDHSKPLLPEHTVFAKRRRKELVAEAMAGSCASASVIIESSSADSGASQTRMTPEVELSNTSLYASAKCSIQTEPNQMYTRGVQTKPCVRTIGTQT
ncbi:uncharacterized protein [Dermacentor andersoni]|uniref:uncharacterized protein n=1 Tax=Dermacentor andersoni TaxID=34620 RepID=UPI00215541CE|nr:peroxynitrite isomerase THAP4-like [Dermacentor andersoni]